MAVEIKVALVTGAASGMGRKTAERLADRGVAVGALDVNTEGLAEVAAGRATLHPYTCDVSDLAAVEKVVDDIERNLGPIDRVVHCAAIMPGAPLLQHGAEMVTRVMRINYGGTVNVVQATLPRLLKRKRGDLICYGSVAAYALTPRLGAYCASKAAVNAFMEVLIHEQTDSGVRIHLACPPMVDTPLIKQAADDGPRSMRGAARNSKLVAKPEVVVDAIENALESGSAISYPLFWAKFMYWTRRISPALLWRMIERGEEAAAMAESGLTARIT
jgi:NAD(P)-dependent dehydrogenase (short-subunit alcohol dehydrogenase family)